MICFPLDNTEYLASALGAWFGSRTRGVFASNGHYAVTANGDMSVTLSAGIAWLKADTYWGVCVHEVNPTVLEIATADGALSRYAGVYLTLDKNANIASAMIRYGAYANNPDISSVPRPIQNNADFDEVCVAAIRIRAGATEILTSDITDLRLNETYCGVMRDGVTALPTQSLYDTWFAWFSSLKLDAEAKAATFTAWAAAFMADNEAAFTLWLTNFKNTCKGDFDGWFGSFKTGNSAQYYNWYNAFKSDSETAFNTWFASIQDQLDSNQAANLQNQINAHKDTFAKAVGGVHGIRYKDGKLQVFLSPGWATLAKVRYGLTSTYIDAKNKTSFEIDAMELTSREFDNLIEMEA